MESSYNISEEDIIESSEAILVSKYTMKKLKIYVRWVFVIDAQNISLLIH